MNTGARAYGRCIDLPGQGGSRCSGGSSSASTDMTAAATRSRLPGGCSPAVATSPWHTSCHAMATGTVGQSAAHAASPPAPHVRRPRSARRADCGSVARQGLRRLSCERHCEQPLSGPGAGRLLRCSWFADDPTDPIRSSDRTPRSGNTSLVRGWPASRARPCFAAATTARLPGSHRRAHKLGSTR